MGKRTGKVVQKCKRFQNFWFQLNRYIWLANIKNLKKQQKKSNKEGIFVDACVAERLTPRTLDLEVRGSSLARPQ